MSRITPTGLAVPPAVNVELLSTLSATMRKAPGDARERAMREPLTSICGRCGHEVTGAARDVIRRMRKHLDSCGA